MGCEALPALSNLACVRSTLSFTVSHSAVICTPGTAEKLFTCEFPRPPVPMTPMRMVSLGLNGTSAMLLPPAVWVRARPAPSDASPASFNKSRREEFFIAMAPKTTVAPVNNRRAGYQPAPHGCTSTWRHIILLPEFPDYLNDDEPADREDAAQNQRIGRSPVQDIADRKQGRPDHGTTHRPAGESQRDIVAFHFGDAGHRLNVPPSGAERPGLFVELEQNRGVGLGAEEGGGDPGDGGDRDADEQLFGKSEFHAILLENQEDDGHAEGTDHGHDLAPRRDAPPEPAQQIQQSGTGAHLEQQVETVLGGRQQENHTRRADEQQHGGAASGPDV